MTNTLFYRLAILNIVGLVWLTATDFASGWFRSWIWQDSSKVTWLILVTFLTILFLTFQKAKALKLAAKNYRSGTYVYIEFIEKAAGWMVVLGMIGTFIGLSISLSGVNLDNVQDIAGIQQIAVKLISGLRVEIAATIIGSMFGVWTEANYQILKAAAHRVK
jgi:hypothetical protein